MAWPKKKEKEKKKKQTNKQTKKTQKQNTIIFSKDRDTQWEGTAMW